MSQSLNQLWPYVFRVDVPQSGGLSPEHRSSTFDRQSKHLKAFSNQPSTDKLLAFLAAYFIAVAFGRWMMVIPDISITIWPPNGVLLGVLIITHPRTWFVWIVAGAAGELAGDIIWFHNPVLPALGYIAANALEVLTAATAFTFVSRLKLFGHTNLTQVSTFLIICVLAAPVVGATIGSGIDAAVGKQAFSITWPLWWLGDATGILIATPLVISAINAWRQKARPTAVQLIEALAIGSALVGLSLWLFSMDSPYAFLLLVPIMWAALRFEFRGATLSVFLLAATVGYNANSFGAENMTAESMTDQLMRLQALLVVAASLGLVVAAIIRQHRGSMNELAYANSRLEQRVVDRTLAIEAAERRFRATFENAAVGIAIVSGDGLLDNVNEQFARMLGYGVNEIEGLPIDSLTHHEDISLGEVAWEKLRNGTSDSYELEKRYLNKNGDVVWGHTSVSCVRNDVGKIEYLIKIIQDITLRRRSDELNNYLMHEVNHRSKNLMSVVLAIARQTAGVSSKEFFGKFEQRMQALSGNLDLLIKSGWNQVRLHDLVQSQLCHFGRRFEESFVINGPDVVVTPDAAQAIGMTLYELGTNAWKYGSLKKTTGRVELSWQLEGDDFLMTWRETGGPLVKKPTTAGFGTTVIDGMVSAALSAEVSIDFDQDGLVWRLRCPAKSLHGQQSGKKTAA